MQKTSRNLYSTALWNRPSTGHQKKVRISTLRCSQWWVQTRSSTTLHVNMMTKGSNRPLDVTATSHLMEYSVFHLRAFLCEVMYDSAMTFCPVYLQLRRKSGTPALFRGYLLRLFRISLIIQKNSETVTPQPSENFPYFFIRKSQGFAFSSIIAALLALRRSLIGREVWKFELISEPGMQRQYHPR